MNLILLSLAATLAASPQTEWMDNYGEALRATRASRRPLLVVLEDSTAGARLRHISDRADAQQIQLLQPYTRCRIDVSTPYGRKVADSFRATTFPTAVVIDKTGSTILARKNGHQTPSEWSNFLAGRPTEQVRAFRPTIPFPAFSSPGGCFT